MVGAEAVLKPP